MHRFSKLNFIFLAMTLILSPLALKAQSAMPRTMPKWTGLHVGVLGGTAEGNYNFRDDSGSGDNFSSALAGGRLGVQGGIDANFKGLRRGRDGRLVLLQCQVPF